MHLIKNKSQLADVNNTCHVLKNVALRRCGLRIDSELDKVQDIAILLFFTWELGKPFLLLIVQIYSKPQTKS